MSINLRFRIVYEPHAKSLDAMGESRPVKRFKRGNDANLENIDESEKSCDSVVIEPSHFVKTVFFRDTDVGIECLLHPEIPGFQGDFKQRYSDFLVNELDSSGNVVRLTDIQSIDAHVPDKGEQQLAKQHVDEHRNDKLHEVGPQNDKPHHSEHQNDRHHDDDQQDDKRLDGEPQNDERLDDDLQDDGQQDANLQLSEQGTSFGEPVNKGTAKRSFPGEKPSSRSDLKQLFDRSEDFQRVLEFYMQPKSERPEEVLIVASDNKESRSKLHQALREHMKGIVSETVVRDNQRFIRISSKIPGSRYEEDRWPRDRPKFCRFVLYKENKDTMEAIGLISQISRIGHKRFGFAGTKDRRAVTAQLATVYKVDSHRLASLNAALRGVCLGNFRYVEKGLSLGQLSGNRFCIVLRKTGSSAILAYNDSAPARLGTHEIGRAILRCEWKEAVDLILRPREGEHREVTRAREIWSETGNPHLAIAAFPLRFYAERRLLEGLAKHGRTNYVNSLSLIPRHLRLMYVHSYQSCIWNKMASSRLRKFGTHVVPGDLVVSEEVNLENLSDDCVIDEDRSASQERPETVSETQRTSVHIVQESEVAHYSIYDVVLPLPGFDVIYPDNDLKDEYAETLKSDGIDVEQMRHKVKDFSLSGGYRKLLAKPTNVSWEMVSYNDPLQSIATTDKDRLFMEADVADTNLTGVDVTQHSEHNYQALMIQFDLRPSQYATMALREILKSEMPGLACSNELPSN